MSGQMKVMIDRGNPLYTTEYKFRDIYLLTTAAENDPETPKRAETGLSGWIDCFPKCSLKGSVFCGGVTSPGDIKDNDKLNEAYEMGKNI